MVKYALAVLSISLRGATGSGFRPPTWIDVIVIALRICLEQFRQSGIKTRACKGAGLCVLCIKATGATVICPKFMST